MDAAYPSMIAHYLFKLGLIHGHAKIQYTLLSMVSIALYRDRRANGPEPASGNLRNHAGIYQIRLNVWCRSARLLVRHGY